MEVDSFIQAYPWIQWNMFDRVSRNKDYTDVIDNLNDKKVRAYCDGWLVIEDMKMHLGKEEEDIKMHHLYLINVKSSEKIGLPPLKSCYNTCILTCSPTDLDCVLLFTTHDTLRYCRLRDKRYRTRKLEEGMHIKNDMVTVLEGKVYYVIDSDFQKFYLRSTSAFPNLVRIECKGSALRFTKMEISPLYINKVVSPFYSPYLVESGGELLLVLKSYRPVPPSEELTGVDFFLLFRFDFVNMSWMQIHDIGNMTIFLPSNKCHGAISFCATELQIKRNSIYFLQNDDQYVHVYDMNNDSFSLVSNMLKMVALHVQEELNGNLDYEKQSIDFLPRIHSDVSKLVLAYLFTLDPGALGVIRSTHKAWGSIVRPPSSDIDLRYNKYPYLVTLTDGKCHFFHPTYNHTFCLDIPELLVDFFGGTLGIFKCGEDSWKIFETSMMEKRVMNNHPVIYKQKCYLMGCKNNLIVVDLTTRNLFVVGKTFPAEFPMSDDCFLVKDGKGLLGVFLTIEKKTPCLMRMDLSQTKKTWQPVQNLKNKMVYVSHAACRSVSAPTKSTGNKIYFPLFQNSSAIFYSLSTGKYHSFSGGYSCETPFEVERMTNCAWIDVN